jgi:hypothetical protein
MKAVMRVVPLLLVAACSAHAGMRGPHAARASDCVSLAADGTVTLGTRAVRLTLERPADDVWLRPIDFGGMQGVILVQPTADDEDPPDRLRVLVADGDRLRVAFDRIIGTYGPTELRFGDGPGGGGDGTISYLEDGWRACQRAGYPETAARAWIILRFDPASKTLIEAERRPTSLVQICANLAG